MDEIKIHKLMNIFPKFMQIAEVQQEVFLFTGNIRKTPFSILIATQREMHQSTSKTKVLQLPAAGVWHGSVKTAKF